MRLINTSTLALKEFEGSDIPYYAILSHTWGNDEVCFADMVDLEKAKQRAGYHKIKKTCSQAAKEALAWAWVDTCCIDKSSSAELSEAINSMFRWYQGSTVCYAYISDFDPSDELRAGLQKCRWLTRGWTLQELIAPSRVKFFDRDWCLRGEKSDICDILAEVSGIDIDTLARTIPARYVPVAQRMSWAAHRTTKRIEDMAYCLLGIFDVNMPLLYGEGQKAFSRLQDEIIKTTGDMSLFAWKGSESSEPSGDSPVAIGIYLIQYGPDLYARRDHDRWFEFTSNVSSKAILGVKIVGSPGEAHFHVLWIFCNLPFERPDMLDGLPRVAWDQMPQYGIYQPNPFKESWTVKDMLSLENDELRQLKLPKMVELEFEHTTFVVTLTSEYETITDVFSNGIEKWMAFKIKIHLTCPGTTPLSKVASRLIADDSEMDTS
ncbi:hypothetical protein DL765_006761 [Monosporascus sp. GIB2]|nr:hypothetical protein DL765_006761 [Monosporascus sp. GIB2]